MTVTQADVSHRTGANLLDSPKAKITANTNPTSKLVNARWTVIQVAFNQGLAVAQQFHKLLTEILLVDFLVSAVSFHCRETLVQLLEQVLAVFVDRDTKAVAKVSFVGHRLADIVQ